MSPNVTAFYEERTGTMSYLVADPERNRAAIIDPVLVYEANAGRTRTEFADGILAAVSAQGVTVDWILDTHPHADHLSAAAYLKGRLGAPVAIGSGIAVVQKRWSEVYNLGADFRTDGSQFDRLLEEGDRLPLGAMEIEVWHTPGHTPACLSYRVGDCIFVGDTLFMPDYGTARCDFPGGDARTLYRSIRRLLSLPGDSRIFVGHDYRPGERAAMWEATVADHRGRNPHVKDGTSEEDFVAMRTERDRDLDLPELILPSLQVNIRAGRLPDAEDNGTAYLKIPLNRF